MRDTHTHLLFERIAARQETLQEFLMACKQGLLPKESFSPRKKKLKTQCCRQHAKSPLFVYQEEQDNIPYEYTVNEWAHSSRFSQCDGVLPLLKKKNNSMNCNVIFLTCYSQALLSTYFIFVPCSGNESAPPYFIKYLKTIIVSFLYLFSYTLKIPQSTLPQYQGFLITC